jgi:hypothetical protein
MEMTEITTKSSMSVKAFIAKAWCRVKIPDLGSLGVVKSEIRNPKAEGNPKSEIRKGHSRVLESGPDTAPGSPTTGL